jgi:PhzF family phenazine biosynthesis protein
MTNLRIIDAFTDRPFAGNPAAVCVLNEAASDNWMQNVAMEMNLAETAFLHPENDGWRLRWFTPGAEVKLCGHATIASAHVLWQDGHLTKGKQARFHTLSGLLTADDDDGWIRLDFPARPADEIAAPPGLLDALGVQRARFVGNSEYDLIVELEDEAAVRALEPDLTRIAKLETRGVIVTAKAETSGFDFVSRFFAPRIGVPEDPVTGSAHCTLTPYWSAKLKKTEMVGYQASPRGGSVKVALRGDRVWLYGQAVTVLTGELRV